MCVCTHIHTYIFIYMHTYICIFMYMYTKMKILIYAYTYIYMYIYLYIHMNIFRRIYIHMYLRTYIHIHRYIHIFVQPNSVRVASGILKSCLKHHFQKVPDFKGFLMCTSCSSVVNHTSRTVVRLLVNKVTEIIWKFHRFRVVCIYAHECIPINICVYIHMHLNIYMGWLRLIGSLKL